MNGYDVGGSHAGSQTGYVTYGLNVQNQTKIEGIDTSEGTDANAGYFDFGSFEEFQVGGAGIRLRALRPARRSASASSRGGDRVTDNWYSDFENDSTISDNVPSEFATANTKDSDRFFTRTPLVRGNPITKEYDLNFNVGGPLWRGKLWGFYSYRLDDQYKAVCRDHRRGAIEADERLHGEAHLSAQSQQPDHRVHQQAEQAPGQARQGRHHAAERDPVSGVANYPLKIEWTSVLGSSMFIDVLYGDRKNFFPLRPADEAGTFDGRLGPGRIDTGNQQPNPLSTYRK